MRRQVERLANLWSTTRFEQREHAAYARSLMLEETRAGVRAMSLVFLLMLLTTLVLHERLGFGRDHVYTASALALLATHVFLSSRVICEVRALHALGMTLLAFMGLGALLAAHRTGDLGAALFSAAALLFMSIPMVPWGLREALLGTAVVLGMFSASTWSSASRFPRETLWLLQSFLLISCAAALTLVGRSARVRKDDIVARYELQSARQAAERRSLQDPLTGAWNRRFLELEFHACVERAHKLGQPLYLAIVDLDGFKELNDTHGHVVGDQALCWVTRAFTAALGDAGTVARAGGDEFILTFTSEAPEETLGTAIAATRALAEAEGAGTVPAIGMSVGLVALQPDRATTLEHAYRRADAALYRAKRAPGRAPGESRIQRDELARQGLERTA